MILAAHQPHYLPYPGLLAKIAAADVFVLQDDLQYVKQEWQNRNRIRTQQGWRWITIPVCVSSSHEPICAVRPRDRSWIARHRRLVAAHYRHAPLHRIEPIWDAAVATADGSLAQICEATLRALCALCRIETPIVRESELALSCTECRTKDDRLINLCRRCGCDRYLSGSGAQAYLNLDAWRDSGLQLEIARYTARPYRQWYEGWVPYLSSLDLVLCVDDARRAVCDDVECSVLVAGTGTRSANVVTRAAESLWSSTDL